MGLIGAFISLSIAYVIQAIMLLERSKHLLQKRVNRELVMKWVKGAPINTVRIISNVLGATDIILMSIITGQAMIVGYWRAAAAASALVASSSALMTGLGPRLISGGSQRDLDKAFDFTVMVMTPMLFGFMVLSRDILWILRPTYSSVWMAACLLALAGVIRTLGSFGAVAVSGMDRFDQVDELPIREYLKSKIFALNRLNLVVTALYVAAVAIYLLVFGKAPIVELVTAIAGINLLFAMIRSIINLNLMRRFTELRLNLKNLPHYLTASIIMTAVVYMIRLRIGPIPARAIEAAPPIFFLVILGAVNYTVILCLISRHFRSYLKEVWSFVSKHRF